MNWEMILAGFGGQGMMFMGQIIARTAMYEGKHTSWIPSYGPEMRGGTANCSVVVSDKPISSPVVNKPNLLVVMNSPSLIKFEKDVEKDGYLFLNSSIVNENPSQENTNIFKIPANELADKLGLTKIANIVMLGALANKTDCIKEKSLYEILDQVVPNSRKEMLELNKKAVEVGWRYAEKNY